MQFYIYNYSNKMIFIVGEKKYTYKLCYENLKKYMTRKCSKVINF